METSSNKDVSPERNIFNSPANCPFISKDWNLTTPSKICVKRVKSDLKSLIDKPLPGIFISPVEQDLTRLNAMIIGNLNTPYEGGFFHFHLRVPPNYPAEPPRVCSVTCYRFGHQVRFNPNLYQNGMTCLSILNTWHGPQWSPVFDLEYLLQSIQSVIFVTDALCNEPGYELQKAKESKMVRMFDIYVKHETIRVAVIHTLKNSRKCKVDQVFVQTMETLFLEFYDSYIESCDDLKKYDDTIIQVGPPVYNLKLTPKFRELKKELIKIHRELKQKGNLSSMQE